MGEYGKKLHFLKNKQQTDITLYTTKSEVGTPALAVKDGQATVYAKLVDVAGEGATDLRVVHNGTTYAVARSNATARVTVPSQSGTLTYTGNAQFPIWNNYDDDYMTISGVVNATGAGTYTAIFTPKTGVVWTDGTTAAKNVTWKINKASGSMSINKTTLTLDASNLQDTVTVTRAGDGEVTATSSDTSIATVSVSGTTVTVTAVANGSATITIRVAAGSNHNAPSAKTVSVTSNMISADLSQASPAQISQAAASGQASTLWNVGDTVDIPINGTVDQATINDTYQAVIIGFDHNAAIEGTNRVHFQIGQKNNQNICFQGGKMNTTNTNSGGWASSAMRTTYAPQFLSALPSEWRNVIKSCVKFTNNTGQNDTAAAVTQTSDKIWLLSEHEVFGGNRTYANQYEKDKQQQYAYYAAGNLKIRYQHTNLSSAAWWWLRSPNFNYSSIFCYVNTSGAAYYDSARSVGGLAFGFIV